MVTGSLDQWADKFWVLFRRPNWCTNVLKIEARSTCVAGSTLPFAIISLFLGVVLNFPLSYHNKSLKSHSRIVLQVSFEFTINLYHRYLQ